MFFMSAGVLVTILTLRSLCAVPPRAPTTGRRGDWRAAAWIFIAAWVIAAAAGTKLNGALTGILFVAALLSAAMLGRFINRSESAPPFRAKLILIAGCSTALAVAIFVALNPYLYDAPISKSASILQVEGDWTLKQQIDPGAPLWLGVQKFTAIAGQDFVVPQSVFHLGAMPCLFVAFAVGVAVVLIQILSALQRRELPVWALTILLWIGVYGFGIGWWIPVSWDRLSFPLAPFIAVVSAYGLVSAARLLSRKQRTHFGRKVWAVGASIPLALVLWYGVRDCSMLPPDLAMIQVNSLDEARKMYERAEDKDPSNPLRAVYAADMRMTQRDFAGACTLYRKAIELLEAAPQQSMERTLLVIAQDRLSYAYLNLSQLNEAKNVLEADIRTLRTIVSHLETVDPKVREEFEKVITERKTLLQRVSKALPQRRNPAGKSDLPSS